MIIYALKIYMNYVMMVITSFTLYIIYLAIDNRLTSNYWQLLQNLLDLLIHFSLVASLIYLKLIKRGSLSFWSISSNITHITRPYRQFDSWRCIN